MIKNIPRTILPVIIALIVSSCASSREAAYEARSRGGEDAVSSPASGESSLSARAFSSENADRMVTYSATVKLSVDDPERTRKILSEQVKTTRGYIVKETENYITARIPADNMDTFINTAKTLGEPEKETKTGTDITDQYQDNLIRLESLKNIRDRYTALLGKADTVSDILKIEKELERVNTEIEILEGRIKHAKLSVAYANITVMFEEKTRPGPIGWIFYGLYHGIKWLFVW